MFKMELVLLVLSPINVEPEIYDFSKKRYRG